jgi:hypothetical protein
MRLDKGAAVEHSDDGGRGVVVAILSPTYVSVQWHDGRLRDEHIADLETKGDQT